MYYVCLISTYTRRSTSGFLWTKINFWRIGIVFNTNFRGFRGFQLLNVFILEIITITFSKTLWWSFIKTISVIVWPINRWNNWSWLIGNLRRITIILFIVSDLFPNTWVFLNLLIFRLSSLCFCFIQLRKRNQRLFCLWLLRKRCSHRFLYDLGLFGGRLFFFF